MERHFTLFICIYHPSIVFLWVIKAGFGYLKKEKKIMFVKFKIKHILHFFT